MFFVMLRFTDFSCLEADRTTIEYTVEDQIETIKYYFESYASRFFPFDDFKICQKTNWPGS